MADDSNRDVDKRAFGADDPALSASDGNAAPRSGLLTAGDIAPDFELASGSGDITRLSWMRSSIVVLYFYLNDRDSVSIEQAEAFKARYPEIRDLDADVLGIGKDGHVSHERLRLDHELPFRLLVDADCSVARLYGAWGERTEYGQVVEGVIRSHFVIDRDGTLLDAAYGVEPSSSVERVMKVLTEAHARLGNWKP